MPSGEKIFPLTFKHIMQPNYNYNKVWEYLKLFQKLNEVSNNFILHQTPTEYNIPEEAKSTITTKEKRMYVQPTPIQINKTPTPEIYILILEHDVQLKEKNGFMEELTEYIRQQNTSYQITFGIQTQQYTKQRMLQTLPQHEHWKAFKATKLYTQIEDYLKAFIATQILFNENDDEEIKINEE